MLKTSKGRAISSILEQAVETMKKSGADHAQASYSVSQSSETSIRLGALDKMQTATSMSIYLAAWMGQKRGSTALISLNPDDLKGAIDGLMASIPSKPDDPHGLPPDAAELSKIRQNNRLDLYDPSQLSAERSIEIVKTMEDAAMSIARVKNSRGSGIGMEKRLSISLSSFGGYFHARSTNHSLSVSVIAEENGKMQSDYAYSSARYLSDLADPVKIGILAGERAAARLNPLTGKPGSFPVIFAPDVAVGLLGHFSAAANGGALRTGQSFLNLQHIGTEVFAKGITIKSNPHLRRGMGSSMYTADGLPSKPAMIVERGVLRGFFMGLENSRFHNQPVLGGANLTIEPDMDYADMIGDIKDGLYVTRLMGQGTNLTNGDYSRSAGGFWIENGQIAYPVESMTLAGNLRDMFRNMTAAHDLDRFRGAASTPHLRVDGMRLS